MEVLFLVRPFAFPLLVFSFVVAGEAATRPAPRNRRETMETFMIAGEEKWLATLYERKKLKRKCDCDF